MTHTTAAAPPARTRARARRVTGGRWGPALVAGVLLAGLTGVMPGPAAADTSVTLAVRVDYLKQIENPDDASGDGDYYPVVKIGDVTFPRGPRIEDDEFEPLGTSEAPNGWFFSRVVDIPGDATTVPVTIQIWDYDSDLNFDDDQMDISPRNEDVELNLLYDVVTNTFTGDDLAVGTPCLRDGRPVGHTCAEGDGDHGIPRVNDGRQTRIGFTLTSTVGASTDSDGDGLSNLAEIHGIRNPDGSMALDLRRLGADPLRKDVFLELDYSAGQAPTRADVQAMKNAMRAAPVDNPDGSRGINLWVDTGALVDTTARRQQPAGTCTDDRDNGGDLLTDGADPDCAFLDTSVEDPLPGDCNNADTGNPACLVGDNLGGGALIGALGNCGIDTAFVNAANTQFAAVRRGVFRYAISTTQDVDTDGGGPDTGCGIGGQASTNNRFFVDYNHDGGTLLHELGHTLGLEHGGDTTVNCKPNYVSVMNYDLQGGVPRVGGGTVLDFSPPRLALDGTSRGTVPGQLVETALTEPGTRLDPNDNANRYRFVDGLDQDPATPGVQGRKITEELNDEPDWNGDGDKTDTTVTPPVNINTAGPPDAFGVRRPRGCVPLMSSADTLTGFHDWNRVAASIAYPGFLGGPRRSEAVEPIVAQPDFEPLPTREDLDRTREAANSTDVGVAISAAPDPVKGGETLTWKVTATNHGPNPASSVVVTTTLPAVVSFVDSSVPCARDGAVLRCGLDELIPGAAREITIRAKVPDKVVHDGVTCTITATAVVDNLAGPDPGAANDTARADTRVLVATGLKVDGPANVANDHPATLRATLTDAAGGPVAGRAVVLTLGAGTSAQSCTATTDAAGVARCEIAVVAQPATATSAAVTAAYAGDACYLPSSASGTAKLLYHSGRSYALSVKTLLLPQTVVADTGEVSTASRSATERTAATLSLPLVGASALKASVVTGAGASTGQATTGTVDIGLPGLPAVRIGNVKATSTTRCQVGPYTAAAAGTVEIGSLTIGGVAQPVGTVAPNSTIRVGTITVTMNEQKPVAGASAGMLVNGLRVSVPGVADVVVASARSAVHNCP
ncbi:hypothetical protein [Sphaerisporangium sp. TRM90804]|uniref:hypothetical protein n=1 Tax=Sphaerisporangium sp. TRM90804 TaxID=3031113 RepID=UPI00244B125F|nr:hypothetical protein [Sphaerisporangium sp. TRM90804]MDH2427467.1 hypothetical protein [Sphaerisporangium sp. TRM90804]